MRCNVIDVIFCCSLMVTNETIAKSDVEAIMVKLKQNFNETFCCPGTLNESRPDRVKDPWNQEPKDKLWKICFTFSALTLQLVTNLSVNWVHFLSYQTFECHKHDCKQCLPLFTSFPFVVCLHIKLNETRPSLPSRLDTETCIITYRIIIIINTSIYRQQTGWNDNVWTRSFVSGYCVSCPITRLRARLDWQRTVVVLYNI